MITKRKTVFVTLIIIVLCIIASPVYGQITKNALLGTSWTYVEGDESLTIKFEELDRPVEGLLAFLLFLNGMSRSYGSVVIRDDSILLRLQGRADWAICTFDGNEMRFNDGNNVLIFKRD
ncbi:MAG: hypothetical protein FWD47_11340 [Treponema sp.]|nr:hypothetical protein [Treponema sp.]